MFSRQEMGIPLNPQYSTGSVLSVGFLTPLFLGLVGGLVGFLFYELKHNK
jgi:ABC-type antimicrobial peptide transport system permease subunit